MAEDDRRMTPLMLSNKRAVVRINQMIDATFGDIVSSGTGAYEVQPGDGLLLSYNKKDFTLFKASGNAYNRVVIKSTDGVVSVKAKPGTKIDNRQGSFTVKHLHAHEFVSDGVNFWVI
jgi:hypothetical protein